MENHVNIIRKFIYNSSESTCEKFSYLTYIVNLHMKNYAFLLKDFSYLIYINVNLHVKNYVHLIKDFSFFTSEFNEKISHILLAIIYLPIT